MPYVSGCRGNSESVPIAYAIVDSLSLGLLRIFIITLLSAIFTARGEALRVSVTRMPVSAPIFLARERGLFEKSKLDVVFREYELGKTALEDLTAGRLDVAFAAVTPVVHKCMAGEQFKILATVASSTTMAALAGRKDLGIVTMADVRGKRVGLVAGTSSEYFFETMRVLNRVPRDSVVVHQRTFLGLKEGLQDGSLDLISTWEPQIQELRVSLTNRLALFFGDGLYTFSWNMVALPTTVASRREELEKLAAILVETGRIIEADPAAAATELRQRLGSVGQDLTAGLRDVRFRPQLGQELLVQMEGEARWIAGRDRHTNSPPNFLRWLDTSVLKKVHPAGVTVIQ